MKTKLTDKQREVLKAVNVKGATVEYWRAFSSSASIRGSELWSFYKHLNLNTVNALIKRRYLGIAKGDKDWRFTVYIITPAGKEALNES